MLPKDIWELLLSHRVHVIACGDPEQLPPINKDTNNHVLDKPHIFLDEIMRQAEESEIIKLTMAIRNNGFINTYKGKEVQVVEEEELIDGMYFWADQILVATNRKRHEINEFIRKQLGRVSNKPEIGDKIICCKNAWSILDTTGEMALVNGTIGTIEKIEEEIIDYSYIRFRYPVPNVPVYRITLKTENGEVFENLPIDRLSLETGEKFLSPQQEFQVYKASKNVYYDPETLEEIFPEMPLEFNYGYAITVHRAQGSEWDKVLVIEETFPFDKTEHRRWLYTACTRPSEKLVLVR